MFVPSTCLEKRRSNVTTSNLLQIDRSKPFDPIAFMGKEWSIAEQDERALAFDKIDLNKVTFETMLRSGEVFVKGEEKLRRLKEVGHIRLDARVLQLLLENQSFIPKSWKSKEYIFFDGTILRGPDGDRYVLCLYSRGGQWLWRFYWLNIDWNAKGFSACLES